MATETEVILVKYQAEVNGFVAEMKQVQKEMATTEKVGVDSANKTTDAFVKTEVATKSLKAQLKELKAQLAVATDPKEVERLAKAAGEISNKLNDATQAAQIFASDSSFEQVGTALRGIAGNLLSLNFKQAADQSKLLVAASKQITFKEALGGIKDLGTTLFNIGKSLLSNPLFLLGSAITLIITNFDKLKASGGAIGAFFTGISNLISDVTNGITAMSDAIGLTDSAATTLAENQKKNAEETKKILSDIAEQIIKNNNEALIALGRLTEAEAAFNESATKFQRQYKAEVLKQSKEIREARKKAGLDRVADSFSDQIQILADEKRFQSTEIAIREQHAAVLKGISDAYQSEQFKANAIAIKKKKDEDAKALKDEADKLKAALDALQKIRDDASKQLVKESRSKSLEIEVALATEEEKLLITKSGEAERLKEIYNTSNKTLQDAEQLKSALLSLEKKYNRDIKALREKSASDAKKINEDMWKAAEKEIDDNVNATINANNKKKKSYEGLSAEASAILTASAGVANDLLNATAELNARKTDEQIYNAQLAADTEIKTLDNLLKTKQISQAYYDKKRADAEKKLADAEKDAKRKQYESDKSIATATAIINTAVAVTKALPNYVLAALAAAAGAIEIALIQSQPTPKFAKGVVDLQGKGTKTSDEIPAMLSKGESVVTADATQQYKGLLTAMNKNKADLYIEEVYLAPLLKNHLKRVNEQKEKGFAQNIANSMLLNSNFKDKNLLQSLKQSRKNDIEIAHYLVQKLAPNYNKYNW